MQQDNEPVNERVRQVWWQLRRGPAVRRYRKRILKDSDGSLLDVPQVEMLRAIVERGSVRMGEIARLLAIDASTATRAIDKLEERDLVRRERSTENARFVAVAVTDHGRRVTDKVNRNEARYVAEIVEELDDEERLRLAELMEELLSGLWRVFPADERPAGGLASIEPPSGGSKGPRPRSSR